MKRATWILVLMCSLLFSISCGDDDDDDDDDNDAVDDDDEDDTVDDDDTTPDDDDDDDTTPDDDDDDDDDTEVTYDDDPLLTGWLVETVDVIQYADRATHTSIAVDSDAQPHIVYWENVLTVADSHLYEAIRADDQWTTQAILTDRRPDGYPSLEIDPDDIAYLSFFDRLPITEDGKTGQGVLAFAVKSAGVWSAQVAAAHPDQESVGYFNSLAVDGDGFAHIGYRAKAEDEYGFDALGYTDNESGAWEYLLLSVNDEPENVTARHISLAVDGTGKTHLCQGSGSLGMGGIGYFTNAGGDWTSGGIPGGYDKSNCSLALDNDDEPYIAFQYAEVDWGEDDDVYALGFAQRDGCSWAWVTIDPAIWRVGSDAYLAIDDQGKAHLAICGFDVDGNPVLKYITNASGEWARGVVDPQYESGYGASIALDGDGYVHVSYIDQTNNAIKYATNRP
ncbi:MAG TPA: hypothetical protein PKW95_15120 [bacterium]|nr:hypothetical protein [bacterium]